MRTILRFSIPSPRAASVHGTVPNPFARARIHLTPARLSLCAAAVLAFSSAASSSAQSAAFSNAQSTIALASGITPKAIAVDAAGNVYVADVAQSQVLKAGWTGSTFTVTVVANAATNGLNSPLGVAVDAGGNVYIADTGNNRVLKETLSGSTYTQSVVANQAGNGLNSPQGVTVDAAGNVYIADATNLRVLKETLSGGSFTQSVVASSLLGPRGVAVDTANSVYIADVNAGSTNGQVLKETPGSGSYTQSVVASHAANGLVTPTGLGVDPAGNVYIADGGLAEILKESPGSGAYTQSVFATAAANGLNAPVGVAVDWSGSVYIADSASTSVIKVQLQAANLGMIPAGSTGSSDRVTFAFNTSATLSGATPVQVLAMGAAAQEFSNAGGGTCTAGQSYVAGNTCTVNVTFAPVYAGARSGAVNLLDSSGNVVATALLYGIGTGPQMVYFGGFEVVPATNIGQATDIAVDSAGHLYVVDQGASLTHSPPAVYKITPATNVKMPLGSGWMGPIGLALDGAGNVYVSDFSRRGVYKITPGGTQSTLPITVQGPIGLALDWAGNLYVADALGNAVYKMSPAGVVTSIGSGWNYPSFLAVDTVGNLYVCEFYAGAVIKLTPAGAQSALTTSIQYPEGIKVDAAGTIYVASGPVSANQTVYQLSQSGVLTPLVTQTNSAYSEGITLDTSGNLYIADSNSNQALPSALIYELDRVDALPTIVFPTATPVGTRDTTDGTQTVAFQNIGNQSLVFATPGSGTNPSYPDSFPEDSSGSNLCTSAQPLARGAICDIAMYFEPQVPTAISDTVVLTDNSLNQSSVTQTVAVSGTGTGNAQSQSISFTQPASPVVFGVAPIALSATATSGLTVTFSVLSGPGSVNGNSLAVNGAGTIVVAANQGGNASYNPAPQVTRSVVVNQAAPVITWPQPAPILYGAALSATQLDATANVPGTFVYTPPAGTIPGTGPQTLSVNFTPTDAMDYTTASKSVTLTVNQTAAITAPAPSSILAGASVTFSWTAGVGATAYELWLGTTGVNSSNIFNSGSIGSTSTLAPGLPTNGVKLFARLWSKINGVWQAADFIFTEAGTPVLAAMTSPSPSSVLAGSSVAFSWTAGGGPTQYELWLGTTAVGTSNVYNSGALTATSITVNGLPTNGVLLYARLWSMINGAWQARDYTYSQSGSPVLAALTSPAPSSVLTGKTVTFQWTPGAGPTQYELWMGTTGPGSTNVLNTNNVTSTAVTVNNVPTNGVALYARLWSLVSGVWKSVDYTFSEAGTPVLAALTTPAPSSVLSGSTVTFQWTAGAGPTQYELWLGTTGPGSTNVLNTNNVTSTSVTVNNVPANGVALYVRLWSKMSGVWQSVDYTCTEAGTPVLAAMTSPAPSSVLAGSSATFQWTAGAGPTQYELWLGTTGPGSTNIYNTNNVTTTSVTVNAIPTNGVTLYARLWSLVSGVWKSVDYTYTEAGTASKAVLTAPAPASVLPGSTATFQWTAGSGPTAYELWLSAVGVGLSDVYNSGQVTATSATVNNLPANGVNLYVRLFSKINGAWQTSDYIYTEAGTPTLAALTTPAPGSQLQGSSVAFQWTSGGGPTQYQLWLGSAGVGSYNLYNSGTFTLTSATVNGLPANGSTIYARLWSRINGNWQPVDFTYTASSTP